MNTVRRERQRNLVLVYFSSLNEGARSVLVLGEKQL